MTFRERLHSFLESRISFSKLMVELCLDEIIHKMFYTYIYLTPISSGFAKNILCYSAFMWFVFVFEVWKCILFFQLQNYSLRFASIHPEIGNKYQLTYLKSIWSLLGHAKWEQSVYLYTLKVAKSVEKQQRPLTP